MEQANIDLHADPTNLDKQSLHEECRQALQQVEMQKVAGKRICSKVCWRNKGDMRVIRKVSCSFPQFDPHFWNLI